LREEFSVLGSTGNVVSACSTPFLPSSLSLLRFIWSSLTKSRPAIVNRIFSFRAYDPHPYTGPDATKGNHCKHIVCHRLSFSSQSSDCPSLVVHLPQRWTFCSCWGPTLTWLSSSPSSFSHAYMVSKVLIMLIHETIIFADYYSRALLTSELEMIFSQAPPAPNAVAHQSVRDAYAQATGETITPESPLDAKKKRIPGPEDDCPVCYEGMHGVDIKLLTFCEQCGNGLHTECFQQCDYPVLATKLRRSIDVLHRGKKSCWSNLRLVPSKMGHPSSCWPSRRLRKNFRRVS
jgi:hypothetical protein